MFGVIDFWTYLAGVILIILLPGPNSLYCLTVASSNKKAGVFAMLGILVGDSILMILTALGAGTFLKLYPVVFETIKLIGGAYLAYLGIRLLMGARMTFMNRHALAQAQTPAHTDTKPKSAFYKALSLSLTNPKAILFFLAFFVQFVNPAYPYPLLSFLILGLVAQLVSFTYLSFLIISGHLLANRFRSNAWLIIVSMAVVGALFIGFGVNMWLSKL